jgi:hypothetical protein
LTSGLLGGFGASAAQQVVSQAGNTGLLPCVYTFSKDYDFSEPYMLPVSEPANVRLDSTFQPDPPEGWFGLGNESGVDPPILALDYFQTAPWFHLAFDPTASDVDIDVLGTRAKANPVANPLNMVTELGATATNSSLLNGSSTPQLTGILDAAIAGIASSAAKGAGWDGILGNMDPMLFFNISVNSRTYREFLNASNSTNSSASALISGFSLTNLSETGFNLSAIQPLSWFNYTSLETDDDLDNLISQDILTTVHLLTLVNASSVRLGYWAGSLYLYPALSKAIQVVSNMPWGITRFGHITNGTVEYMIQMGTDSRLANIASYPPEGLRKMAFQTQFARAALGGRNVSITPVYQVMPRFISTKIDIPASLLSARILFPFGISFFIPLFVYTLTLEKQSRIFIMMKVSPSPSSG